MAARDLRPANPVERTGTAIARWIVLRSSSAVIVAKAADAAEETAGWS